MPQPRHHRVASIGWLQRHVAAIAMAFAGIVGTAHAQTPPAAPASAASAPSAQLERVEIRATRPSDNEERRRSTAAKIVVGREEIERYGDTNLGDVLKRLPGVTMQGPPGRGGNIRMRGLGGGYTQILLDGQRIPPGFSLDSLTPEQIERIEILRAPTAETGARAIAGTINIVTREGFNRRINELRLTAGLENGRLQPHVAWTRNEPLGPFIVNYSLSAFDTDRDSDSTTTTVARSLVDESVTLAQRDSGVARDRRHGVHATGRLQWRGEQGIDTVTLMPLLLHTIGRSQRSGVLTQRAGASPPAYDTAVSDGENRITLARLNGQWSRRLDTGGRVEFTFGAGDARFSGSTRRKESTAGALTRRLDDQNEFVDRNLLGGAKLIRTLAGEHSLVAGAEGEANRRTETRVTNDPALLANFGDNVGASSTRLAAYVQDEWSLTPRWAAHAGLRWEGITTRGETGANDGTGEQANRSSVWTPLLHAVWKPVPDSRDQLRISLTRSYRSPTLQSLIGRPSINTRYPAPGANTPTQPDRAGNPNLRPEVATGLDVAVERYLGGSGVLSANVFRRQIRDYLRSQVALEDVAWSPGQRRYVSRPQNIGDAMTQGLELEAKFRLNELIAAAPGIDLRANASAFRSRVKAVPGPDNRLDQQPGYTANLGADYRVPGRPLTIGGNLNWTPAYDTRVSEEQRASQGR
ncbi:MAG: TonB-dependent receptor, partial [Rhizobiales bacterium]|nr:TonB-dependent receptor [Rhizobacter sp.]